MTTQTRQKPCEQCGEPIIEQPRWSETQWEARQFCCTPCRSLSRLSVGNAYRMDGDVAYIDVSTKMYPGKEAMIDAADLLLVLDGRGKWYARRDNNGTTFYATREINENGQSRADQMHRVLLGLENGHAVLPDHKDHDGLNNRRNNLRASTHSTNRANGGACKPGKFKGVYRRVSPAGTVRFRAIVTVNGEDMRLGDFLTPDEAARAYDTTAYATWGEFAYLNFPREP